VAAADAAGEVGRTGLAAGYRTLTAEAPIRYHAMFNLFTGVTLGGHNGRDRHDDRPDTTGRETRCAVGGKRFVPHR